MLDTFIKNRGTTKTIIHANNRNQISEVNWDADYDGDKFNIYVDSNDNGRHKQFDVTLDNEDLANMLNISTINEPLEKRLKKDFMKSEFVHDPNVYMLELQEKPSSIKQLLNSMEPMSSRHISSPLTNEEFIVPITINEKTSDKFTLTPRRKHKKLKTHKTHKIYKKHKTSSSKKSKKSSKRSRRSSSVLGKSLLL
jgi:hypothetical protein